MLAVILVCAAGSGAAQSLDVKLTSSEPSPTFAGSVITWKAEVPDANGIWYRFRAGTVDGPLHTIRDFGPQNLLDWTAESGIYVVEVTARNRETGETASTNSYFQLLSRAQGSEPALTPTTNSLVFLFSAPDCPEGAHTRVQYQAGDAQPQATPWRDCLTGRGLEFYLAGMRAETEYSAQQVVQTESGITFGSERTFTTGALPTNLPNITVLQSRPSAARQGITVLGAFGPSFAVDADGNVVWHHCCLSHLTRVNRGASFIGVLAGQGDQSDQTFREFDLQGLTLRETNAARVNEQLAAIGMGAINGFHHEVRRLPDGKILALAGTERFLEDLQAPGRVNVLGDMILVLDDDLQLLWAWDAFDHLDVYRKALLDERCQGCPKLFNATANQTRDWVHGNAVGLTPDGNLLYSARHQDMLYKIDYRDGSGNGDVLWKLGKDGDFRFESSDPYPWFSHQHDGDFESDGTLTVFDNGNLRNQANSQSNSRGQAIQLDEATRTARLLLNADLGAYSFALGSAQRGNNGEYFFDNGFLGSAGGRAEPVVVNAEGVPVFKLGVSASIYRGFIMRDIYNAQQEEGGSTTRRAVRRN